MERNSGFMVNSGRHIAKAKNNTICEGVGLSDGKTLPEVRHELLTTLKQKLMLLDVLDEFLSTFMFIIQRNPDDTLGRNWLYSEEDKIAIVANLNL